MPGYSLGLDILSRFRVTLDFPNKAMLLERPKDYAQRVHIDGSTGIRLTAQGNGYVIARLDAGSPAAKADVQVGDRVVQIDGKALDGLSSFTANRLLGGFAGTHAELVLQRPQGQDNKQITITFDRSSTFAHSLPVDGLFLDLPAHKPMELIGLLQGCSGAQAGLKEGDIILEFNGKLTQDATPTILADEYRKDVVTLKVKRKGVSNPLSFTLKAKPMPASAGN